MGKINFKNVAFMATSAFLILFATGSVNGQSTSLGPHFGLKGGINLSQLYVDQVNVDDESMKLGLNFGVFAKIPLTNVLALQPEILYSSAGSKVTYGGSDLENILGIESGEVRFNLNYIQVPIALALNLGPLNIHVGPYFSYLLSAKVKDLKASDLSSNTVATLDKEDFRKFDYGVMAGLAIDVKSVTLGARYNYGLREVGKSGYAGLLTDNSKNGVAQIYVGFGL